MKMSRTRTGWWHCSPNMGRKFVTALHTQNFYKLTIKTNLPCSNKVAEVLAPSNKIKELSKSPELHLPLRYCAARNAFVKKT